MRPSRTACVYRLRLGLFVHGIAVPGMTCQLKRTFPPISGMQIPSATITGIRRRAHSVCSKRRSVPFATRDDLPVMGARFRGRFIPRKAEFLHKHGVMAKRSQVARGRSGVASGILRTVVRRARVLFEVSEQTNLSDCRSCRESRKQE